MFGFSTSFLGMLAPGMLNMTTVKIRIERGKFNAMKFAFGVSTIVLVQAYVAVFFIKYLKENPDFIQILQEIASVIFVLLSLYFYREFKKEAKMWKEIFRGYDPEQKPTPDHCGDRFPGDTRKLICTPGRSC